MNRRIRETIDKSKLREQEHNYELVETDDGFMVVPIEIDREPVIARLDKNGFWRIDNFNYEFLMYDFFSISQVVIDKLYESWKSPVFNPKKNFESGKEEYEYLEKNVANRVAYSKVKEWAKLKTKRTLAKTMRDLWKKKNEEIVLEETRLLHRKVFSISSGKYGSDTLLKILENKEQYEYLIKDLLNYRAARALLATMSDKYFLNGDWKEFFGDMSSGSMRKTLMNIPGVPYWYVTAFSSLGHSLPEPATTMIRYMAYASISRHHSANWKDLSKVILRSSDNDIKEAVEAVWEYNNNRPKGGFRNARSIEFALNFIYDYNDEIGEWDINGLCKRSIKYHIDLAEGRRIEELDRLKKQGVDLEQKTSLPPLPLPADNNIRFLDTFGSIIEEGNKMGHCIGGYASEALRGNCYLFHVDYAEEMASVEVSPYGYVVQSHGPQNKSNKASAYGQRVLSKWSKELGTCKTGSPSYALPPAVHQDALDWLANWDEEEEEDIPF